MYLKELRLHGFKSFADPTRLDLRKGVTAIVGPNGCGKSNIADALRWVLGEQSAKSLRAGAMQDVIFQGTTGRKPVNLCEVTLTFTDCEDRLGTAYHEVEITRRVIRDGGSEYLLNGKQCRLKDIQRLFLDTGVGQVSYSFMLQGQIDQVLSNNPSERRAIFEEAAGISKYKAQRREALSKLSQVDANLARVTDVIEEVGRQIGSLKRQASKALRFKRIRHRLSHLELGLNGFRYGEMNAEITRLEEKTKFLQIEAGKLEREIEQAENGLSGKRQNRNDLNNQLQAAQSKVYEIRTARENAKNRAEFAVVRREDLEKRIAAIETELSELEREQKSVAEQLAGEAQVKEEQMNLFGNSDEIFQDKSREIGEIQQQLANAETEYSRSKHALTAKEGSISRLRSNCTTLEVDLKTYQVRHANLTEEIQLLREESALLEQDVVKLERARESRLKEKEVQEQRIEELKATSQALTSEYRELQRRLQETDRQIAGVQAQVSVLEDLQAKFEGFSEGARAILQGSLEKQIGVDDYVLFLKNLQVESRYTKALETLLGRAADGILVKDYRRIGAIAEELRENRKGRASLLVQRGQAGSLFGGAPAEAIPNWLIPAKAVVSSTNTDIATYLEAYLAGCYFCESLDDFLNYWEGNPKFIFQAVVTESGEWVDSRGVILAGASKNDKANASFLARQNQLKTFKRQLEDLRNQHESFKLQVEQLQGKLDGLDKQTEDQRRFVGELSEEVSTLVAQKQGAERNAEQNRRGLQNKEDELERLEGSKAQSMERLDKAQAELSETEEDIEKQKRTIQECEEAVVALREQREVLRETFNEARMEIAQKKQRLEMLDRGLQTLQQKAEEVSITRDRREDELKALRHQIAALNEESASQEESVAKMDETLQLLMAELEKNRSALAEVEKSIETVEEGFRSKRETHQKLNSELNKEEVQLARLQSRLQFIVEEMVREYEIHPKTIDWKLSLWKAGAELPDRIKVDIEEEAPEDMEFLEERDDPTEEDLFNFDTTDWGEIEEEVKSLRTRIQSMGPVNLVAIEEYKSLRERHEFLKSQSSDLWQAKEQLVNAIDEINAKSQELFADTFHKIRKNFKYTFDTLFGGGNADLQLVDSEDVLESGIDISAQPPGTRLKSLALLSGGQKTMTAVALLFAIYMVKPSPFCVLDEIDAPLDDANIGRFTKMLESFLEFSQFLIITHNKRTISVADTIYGATMQEKGVSRIVSMRFDKRTGKPEALAEVEAEASAS